MSILNSFKKRITLIISLTSVSFLALLPSVPDEGMYPLSEIHKIDLTNAGLKIDIDEVYNTEGASIVDALVKVGGCTGSFVSAEGLILTNHHCAFGAVQRVSTIQNNYLENGFLAKNKHEELEAKGITCRITDSYQDVSDILLEAANSAPDIASRTKAIADKISELVAQEQKKDSTITAQVSEMFVGKSYVLFRYKTIYDVRLVYVPPRSIGEFGGESDNWIWPRHTGDFAFLRAYVAPDGMPAKYSEENIPYTPKHHLTVNPSGVEEEDFVFLLGYPGRTFRHQPSQYLEYQQKILLPYISKLNRWLIDLYEMRSADDPDFGLSISSRIKSLANTMKNYEGKLNGIDRLNLIENKKKEEEELYEYIRSDSELFGRYGNILNEIDEVYKEIFHEGRIPLFLSQLKRNVNLFQLVSHFIDYENELLKPEAERKEIFKEEKKNELLRRISAAYSKFDPALDQMILEKMLSDIVSFPEFEQNNLLQLLNLKPDANYIKEITDKFYNESVVLESDAFKALFELDKDALNLINDSFINFARNIGKIEAGLENAKNLREGKLNILLAPYLDMKMEWQKKSFIPDANSTLRLTYGYVRGYSPADAVYYSSITTLRGVIEKGKAEGNYSLHPKIKELYEKKDFGQFKSKKLNDVPVGILYNTDTSGGNSGSPILNAYGELVGVNFDRAYEATINDFAWSEDYSRSIGVDIRYILWITQKLGKAEYLLKEMGLTEING